MRELCSISSSGSSSVLPPTREGRQILFPIWECCYFELETWLALVGTGEREVALEPLLPSQVVQYSSLWLHCTTKSHSLPPFQGKSHSSWLRNSILQWHQERKLPPDHQHVKIGLMDTQMGVCSCHTTSSVCLPSLQPMPSHHCAAVGMWAAATFPFCPADFSVNCMLWAKITIGKSNCIYHVGDSASYIRMLHSKTTEFSLFSHRQQNNDWQESPDIRHLPSTQAVFPPASRIHQPGMSQQSDLQVKLKLMKTPTARGQFPTANKQAGIPQQTYSTILSVEAQKDVGFNFSSHTMIHRKLNFPCLRRQWRVRAYGRGRWWLFQCHHRPHKYVNCSCASYCRFSTCTVLGYFSLDFPSLLRPLTLPLCNLVTVLAHCFLAQFVSLGYVADLLCCCEEGFKITQCPSQSVQIGKSTAMGQAPSLLTEGGHRIPPALLDFSDWEVSLKVAFFQSRLDPVWDQLTKTEPAQAASKSSSSNGCMVTSSNTRYKVRWEAEEHGCPFWMQCPARWVSQNMNLFPNAL